MLLCQKNRKALWGKHEQTPPVRLYSVNMVTNTYRWSSLSCVHKMAVVVATCTDDACVIAIMNCSSAWTTVNEHTDNIDSC